MTDEKLKQLKPGDEIFIRARYKKIDADGDVLFLHSNTNVYDEVVDTESYTHPGNVILPPSAPKYDPCRRFKKGDKVRVVAWNGRNIKPVDMPADVEVELDERPGDINVSVFWKCAGNWGKCNLPQCFLELVFPVEELEPYFVMELKGAYGVYNTRFQPETEACHFFTDMHPNAKEAAEAECARLNAEHRKNQSNG